MNITGRDYKFSHITQGMYSCESCEAQIKRYIKTLVYHTNSTRLQYCT